MQSNTRDAVLRRLQYAVAELEVVMGIADCAGESALREEARLLVGRVRECIDAVSQGHWAQPSG